MIMTPCDLTGIKCAHDVMKHTIQSSLSAFHTVGGGGGNSTYNGGMEQIKTITDLLKQNRNFFMKVKVLDDKKFKKKYISRNIIHYTMSYRSHDFHIDNFWIKWNTDKTTIRLYINYVKLIYDHRTLLDLKNVISPFTRSEIKISADIIGIIDIQINETDTTLSKAINDILNIKIGMDNILEYNGDNIIHGSNILSLMRDNESDMLIDKSTMWSNDIDKIYKNFGIEAVNCVMRKTLNAVLADYATIDGVPKSFNKYGIDISESKGILPSMAFERATVDLKRLGKFLKHGINDNMSSVLSQMMIGNESSKIGSNSPLFDIIMEK